MTGPRWLWPLCVAALAAIAVRLAWLGDDAYITLRSVEHFASGEGLRWNTMDRVQVYTHPAWMLLLSFGRWLSGEVYFTTLAISLLLSVAAIALLLRRATAWPALLAVTVVLATTRAFVEYTTSGLETPLTYVLLVAFGAVVGSERPARQRCFLAASIAALGVTTRMDLALLFAPAVWHTMRPVGLAAGLRLGLLAATPFLAWLVFAGIYYGSPFPVTAHAKLFGVGIPAGEMLQQGLHYAAFALTDDPVLLPTIGFGLAVGLWQRQTRMLAVGALLYCGYVLKVGGDFMAGRFFLPPFVVAVLGLVGWLRPRSARHALVVAAGAVALLPLGGLPPWWRGPASDTPPTQDDIERQHGIVDERRMHYSGLGLLAPTRVVPRFGSLVTLPFPAGRDTRWFLLNGSVGGTGFQMGSLGHLVDPLLCDPLLTRLPARDPKRWRIGHILRRIPEGYYETLAAGENRLFHPGLRDYYAALRTLTQAPVFAPERLAVLARMALGTYDDGFRAFVAEHYYRPPRIPVGLAELPPPLAPGAYWFDEPRIRIVYDGGLAIALPAPRRASTLTVQALSPMCFDYRVRFLRGGEVRGEAIGATLPPPADLAPLRLAAGLLELQFVVPAAVGEFDTLWFDFVETALSHTATGPAGCGALTLVD
jgi:arabinofuranosyltransferase